MKWINCADNCPEVIHENIIIRNAKTKGIIENGYFRSYANKSSEWALNNFEWLDESEPSFSIEDMHNAYKEGKIQGFEKCGQGISSSTFDEFMNREHNIDLTK